MSQLNTSYTNNTLDTMSIDAKYTFIKSKEVWNEEKIAITSLSKKPLKFLVEFELVWIIHNNIPFKLCAERIYWAWERERGDGEYVLRHYDHCLVHEWETLDTCVRCITQWRVESGSGCWDVMIVTYCCLVDGRECIDTYACNRRRGDERNLRHDDDDD